MTPKIVFIGSQGGSVLSRLGRHAFVRDMTLEAVSDRGCAFLSVAGSFGIPATELTARTGPEFSDLLHDRFRARDDIVFLSFYTKLFSGDFLAGAKGRVFNCHPSILPAFKGLHGFEDTLDYGSRFMGCTLHAVDATMDGGAPVIQAALPVDPGVPRADNRHRIFLAQYYSTLQFLRWVHDGRLAAREEGLATKGGFRFAPSIFSPNLDPDFFDVIGEENLL